VTPSGPLEGVLLDMDGTLVDTEPYWITAELDLVARHGGSWTYEQALGLVGQDLMFSADRLHHEGGVPLAPQAIVEALLDSVLDQVRREIPWRPGARELVADLQREQVPTALVTMSWRSLADAVLAGLPGVGLDAVVTGDMVARGKPHPEPYLTGADRLGVDPTRCVAIEDSPAGAASAEAAGCLVVVVPNHVDVPDGPRRVFLPSLAGVDGARLGALLDRQVDRVEVARDV
jgi:HAD superfamily hydrolase (TIGR01509 family)